MPSRTRARSRHSRRFVWLALLIVAAIAGYSAVWFYAARGLEAQTAALVARLNRDGVRASCEEASAGGYPFRIGLFCRSVFYEDSNDGISVRAGALRSAAQIYQPQQVIGELDAPAQINLPRFGPLEAQWENLRASARLDQPLPQRLSSEVRQLALFYDDADETLLIEAEAMELHARRNGADLDIAGRVGSLVLTPALSGQAVLPAFDGAADATIDDGVRLLADGARDIRGMAGTIRTLRLTAKGSDAAVSLSGPVSVREDGLVDAELKIAITDVAAVSRMLADVFPGMRDEIGTAASALSGMGGTASLQLRISAGKVFLGFIPLGRIPPL